MSKGKMRGAFLLALLVLVAVPLAGCQFGDSFPFYLMEKCEDGSEVLYMDGVQYVRKQEWNENANYYNGGYCWTPADGIGEQIGVCGKDADEEAILKIYEVAGDEEHIFLYTWPAHFYFGGTETRLWMQDGVTLGTPTAEMVSSVTLIFESEDSTSAQVDDPAMIAALLEAYSGDSVQVPNSEDWVCGYFRTRLPHPGRVSQKRRRGVAMADSFVWDCSALLGQNIPNLRMWGDINIISKNRRRYKQCLGMVAVSACKINV